MNIFMDSGAFSAWTKKTEINLQEYIDFLHKHKKHLTVYANLDVIGDPVATWKNHEEMEKQGLKPLPIFHRGSNISFLHRCMNYEYFALGAIAKAKKHERINYLDMVFNEICGKDGLPRNKVHGLGTTSFSLMRRYPFYSVDSTTWILTGVMGIILVPQKDGDGFDFNKDPFKIAISEKSPKTNKGAHYDSLSKDMKKHVVNYVEEMGYSLGEKNVDKKDKNAGLYADDGQRVEINAKYFIEFQHTIPEWPWMFKKPAKTVRLF